LKTWSRIQALVYILILTGLINWAMAKPPKGHIPLWRLHKSNFKKGLLSIIYSINIIHAAGIVRRNCTLRRTSITNF
jgi:hypothetical protein